ncbi:DNAJ heat shock N-terminal domain-containing protein isoform X2 [Wolffia australiana]
MATATRTVRSSTVVNNSSSVQIRRYALPFILFAVGIFFQLVVFPSSFTVSHYEVLGLRELAPVDEVVSAYEKFSSEWNAGLDVPTASRFIEIRHAFDLLTSPIHKRDYDTFGIDEHSGIIQALKNQHEGRPFAQVHVPLLDVSSFDSMEGAQETLTAADFVSDIGKNVTWLIQVYSMGSLQCKKFYEAWKRISTLVEGVANTGLVELSQVEVASFLAEKRATGKPFFQGLPSLVAFPPNCRSARCYTRYNGDLTVDAIIDWMATSVLVLPRILYYSRRTLNKIVIFSETGERASPYLRQAAKDYWAHVAIGLVRWEEDQSSHWRDIFGVEFAPAVVCIKETGVKPVVYHGPFNRSWFLNMIEENKYQELPQLRSITSMELGCDAKGYSRAGNDISTWYCVIAAGRPSFQLNGLRETLRSAKTALVNVNALDNAKETEAQFPRSAAYALKERRLTFAWLDGETQSRYCFFYLHSENSYETCGPRRYGDPVDSPRLFVVRYRRNSTENMKPQKKMNTIWDGFQEVDQNLASQLVARYNGSDNVNEIIKWISQIINDGDNKNLPNFIARTPELVPEDKGTVSPSVSGAFSRGGDLKTKVQGVLQKAYDHWADPRLGPLFMLAACISFSTIWLQNNRKSQPHVEAVDIREEPQDARQALSTDSDTDSG